MRTSGNGAVARLQYRSLTGKVRSVSTPSGVVDQFFISVIGVIDGMKECFGIGDVNGDRDAQPAAFLPDRVEPRIIDSNQFACLVFHPEAEIFQYLEAASPARNRVIKLRHHFLTEVRIINF